VRRTLRERLLSAARTDREAMLDGDVWLSRCIHCRSRVGVTVRGEPLGTTTLEHIVPRAWFDRRGGGCGVAGLTDPDDPRNLALACARCNQLKGKGHDARGRRDPRAVAVVEALLARRQARFREARD